MLAVIFQGYDGKHLMTYQFDAYKNIQLTRNYRNTNGVYHNAQGFRENQDTPKEKMEDTYRIFVMGGSTAYGAGSNSSYGQRKYSVVNRLFDDFHGLKNGNAVMQAMEIVNREVKRLIDVRTCWS